MTTPDPLAQLRDIHLPTAVSGWPPGPGWWLLGALALFMIAAGVFWFLRRRRANAWRREAIAELNAAYLEWQAQADAVGCLHSFSAILKRAALRQFPNYDVARLSGSNWEAFLDRQWRKHPEQGFTSLGFTEQTYRPPPADLDMNALHTLALRWLQQLEARPC